MVTIVDRVSTTPDPHRAAPRERPRHPEKARRAETALL
jgi:hypothetical protein